MFPNQQSSVAQMTGLPVAKRKSPKKVRRGGKGRKPSGNPLNQHASNFMRAHQAGNVSQARTHALNYANASMQSAPKSAGMQAPPAEAAPYASPTQSAPMGAQDMGGSDWIQGAIHHPGALHSELHVPQGQKIPAAKIAKAEHSSNPLEAKRARLAVTLKKMHAK